jgi:hypothetical protein
MIDTSPIELTDEQWTALLADYDGMDSFTVKDFDDVEQLLVLAREKLGNLPEGHPLSCPELLHMALWDTSDANNWSLMMTVDLAGLRLATDHVKIGPFRDANETPGEPVLRAVLGELLDHRNRLVRKLARHFTATGVGATSDPGNGTVTLDIDTAAGTLHIDLSEEYGEALGGLLLDDPAHSDGTGHELDIVLAHEQLQEWAGSQLDANDISWLDDQIPHSSIPEAINTICTQLDDEDQEDEDEPTID